MLSGVCASLEIKFFEVCFLDGRVLRETAESLLKPLNPKGLGVCMVVCTNPQQHYFSGSMILNPYLAQPIITRK